MVKLIALDNATATGGYAIFYDEELIESGIFTAKGDLEERLIIMKHHIIDKCNEHKINALIMEQEQVHKIGNVTNALCKLQGVTLSVTDDLQLAYYIVPINTWRISVGIKHNMKRELQKSEAIKKVKSLYYVDTKSDDEAEAILIGRYAIKNKLFVDRV